ncbi:dipeptide ABC transporter ATP-binding protein [Cronobacter condimenti]|uniref:dipeptide ABC transporter ATP-binding protein n=1 Tax=Cronobacter condimenti TaxID=1163710 RepID=UPI0006AC0EE1|nr:ABC transporter ATP-binding protein [Cronobacter condimenti]
MPLLTVSHLSLQSPQAALLHDVSLTVERREMVALVGESGCGKTLTSLAITGLLPRGVWQSGGEICFDDTTTIRPDVPYPKGLRGRRIAMIFQEPMSSMNPVLKVGEQIAEVLVRHRGLGWKAAWREAVALLGHVGIGEPEKRARQYIHQLSGGMRQRVMIASAISGKPDLLIADEPTTALDVTLQAQILSLLKNLQQEMGMGVLLVTHDLSVVARYADRACVMNGGEIVEQGPVGTLFTAPQADWTRRLIAASLPQTPPARTVSHETPPLLQVTDIVKSFPRRQRLPFFPPERQRVLHPTSLCVARGEIVGLIGESGSGKTTLGRAAIGLIEADSGAIFFDGVDMAQASRAELRTVRRRAQMIFQDPYASLDPRMSVGEQLAEPLRVHGLRQGDGIAARVSELMTLVGLKPEWAQRRPAAFSGGQRQRIAIARALALEPDLLVADEAVAALDLPVRGQILRLLAELRDKLGLSVLFISHDLQAVRQLCDRVLVLYLGEVVEEGPACQVLQAPAHPYTQRLIDSAPDIHQALRLRDTA